jgi:signal transduction histidine kinase
VGTVLDYRPAHASLLKVYDVCFAALPIAFLAGMTRLYLGRSTVGRLLVRLRGPLGVAELRDLLADALGDPSLQVGFRAESGTVDVPRLDPARAVTPIGRVEGRRAVLVHDRLLNEDRHVLASVAAAAGLALENAALTEQVARQLAEVGASRTRIVEAADTERRRIERNLHDGAQQTLVTALLGVRLAQRHLAASGPEASAALDRVAGQLSSALEQIRELARGLHPAILTEDGLIAALEVLLERLPAMVEFDAPVVPRLAAPVESTSYYVVAEALTNALKHAGASRLAVRIRYERDALSIQVRDDGRGGADPVNGSGLLGLRDRVEAVGGRFEVDSRPGEGTTIEAVIST